MAFKKLNYAPDSSSGETYINPEHIAEIVLEQGSGDEMQARVKFVGGAVTRFEGKAAVELRQALLIDKSGRVVSN